MNNNRRIFTSKIIDSFNSIHETPIEKFICINSLVIKFIFYNDESSHIFMRPFQHIMTESTLKFDFVISVADSTMGIPSPRTELIVDPGLDFTKTQNLYYNTDTMHMLHNTQSTITSLVDESTNQAYYFVKDLNNLPDYEKAAPFRMIMHWFCSLHGMSLIHGAVIASDSGGWLVAGKGGSGKSTLTLLSYMNGNPILGDDYVIIDNLENPVAYSLYNSIKVNPDIVEKYPYIDHYLANRSKKDSEKCYLFADEIPGPGMTLKSEINGIIVATGEKADLPAFNKATAINALSVIGSSSVFQMPGAYSNLLKSIAGFTNKLDVFRFILGHSIEENLASLLAFIDELPLVSVIMPVYNGAARIDKSITSVLNQTYKNIELIIIDDGSTDDSKNIITDIPDERIQYFYQDNQGPAAARNNGISKATGRYIAFIDHDDTWHSNKLETQLAYIRNNPGLDVLYCRHNLEFKGAAEDYIWPQHIKGAKRFNHELPSSMFADRSVFDRFGIYNYDYRVLEDTELHLRLLDSGARMHTMEDCLFDKYLDGTDPSRNQEANDSYIRSLFISSIKRKNSYKNMSISVVIPVYNPDKHLISCIKSILSQTLQPYEIIVVDDGSDNNVARLLSCFNNDRIKIYRQDNKGISGARNFGISKAGGNILAFIDGDDLWTENKLELQVKRLISDSSIHAVFGHIRQFYSPEVDDDYRKRYFFKDKVTPGIIPGTMVIRKDDFEKVGLFNENLRLGELFDWIHRFKKAGLKHAVIPDIVMYRRLHYNNNGILNKQDRKDFAKAFAQIIKDKKNGKA